ncbi:hypothetical protein EV578_1268 [Streptomyces sp. BK205]|nr:hypothetical protein EV578_1268 [Streptomyces sp. BK205]
MGTVFRGLSPGGRRFGAVASGGQPGRLVVATLPIAGVTSAATSLTQARVQGAFEYSPVHTSMYWVASKRPPCCGKNVLIFR